jgi:PAS domain-containing protein
VAENSTNDRRKNGAVVDVALLGAALAKAEAGVCIFDEQRRYHWVNDRFLELAGYTRDEFASFRAGEILRLTPLDQDEFIDMVTAAISAGEADIVRANGEYLATEYVVIPTAIDNEPCFMGLFWPLDGRPLPEDWSKGHR